MCLQMCDAAGVHSMCNDCMEYVILFFMIHMDIL